MKSDQEFLQGIYEKVEHITQSHDSSASGEPDSSLDWMNIEKKKSNSIYRYGSIAALFLLMTMTAFQAYITQRNHQQNTTTPIPIKSLNSTDSTQKEQPIDSADSIVRCMIHLNDLELELDEIQIGRGAITEDTLLTYLISTGYSFSEGDKIIALFQKDGEELIGYDIYLCEGQTSKYYVNNKGIMITEKQFDLQSD